MGTDHFLEDNIALVADLEDKVKRLMSDFNKFRERRRLKINIGRSKVIMCYILEEIEIFRFRLRSSTALGESLLEVEVRHRLIESSKR